MDRRFIFHFIKRLQTRRSGGFGGDTIINQRLTPGSPRLPRPSGRSRMLPVFCVGPGMMTTSDSCVNCFAVFNREAGGYRWHECENLHARPAVTLLGVG